MSFIKKYEEATDYLNSMGSWTYTDVIGINYVADVDFENKHSSSLTLDFNLSVIETSQRFRLSIKYYNISDLSLKKVTNFYLNRGLIIHDKKELGWDINQRYHIHDDSGYGENDGYNFIEFYCSEMEVISLKQI